MNQTAATLFPSAPNLRRGNEPNAELTLAPLGTPHMWQGANVRRGALGAIPNRPLIYLPLQLI
jgi:hypothetical protein